MTRDYPRTQEVEGADQLGEFAELRKARETAERYDRLARRVMVTSDLSRHEFRLFAYYLFKGDSLKSLRKVALRSGTITLQNGRVIRRIEVMQSV